jgi:TfoX/Sxy family transcriptional regulator of competence genes
MPLDADLLALLLDAAEGLPFVEERRMFAGRGLWVKDRIFALVYRGRIVLKLTEPGLAAKLRALDGAGPFMPGRKRRTAGFSAWIETPEWFGDDPHELRRWTALAHDLALRAPPPARKKKRGRPA